MRKRNGIGLAVCALLTCVSATAQNKALPNAPAYPQNYFRNPLDIPIFLAGNFGECRPGHFHSGVDIKTLGKENQKVHAAADGYISRIKMEKGGFGHGLYITHPNGYTTLYAHLNDFVPAIQEYVKREQYAKKHWDVDITLTPDQFPVKKGQQIAWSGNTGASTAPHLHFEIRDSKKEHPLNPQLFGLPITDKMPPVPAEVAFYRPEMGEDVLPLTKKGGVYVPIKSVAAGYEVVGDTVHIGEGLIGIGINVDDYMDGSDNTIGFYTTRLFVDDSLQAQVTLDDIGYDETRYINAYTDYAAKQQHHVWIQRLYQLPGNRLDRIYSNLNANKGFVNLGSGRHKITIIVTDDKANESKVAFYTSFDPARNPHKTGGLKGWTRFYANKQNIFLDSNVVFTLDDKALYEDCWFRMDAQKNDTAYSSSFHVGQPWVPIHTWFDLHLKPSKPIPAGLEKKIVIMYSDDHDVDGRNGVQIENGWYKARVRNFGTYWLALDTIPPTITSMQKNGANMQGARQIAFDAKDDMTSVRKFSGYLDGQWICFEQHANSFFYKFDSHCPKGKHELVFTAEDENGNGRDYHLTFTR